MGSSRAHQRHLQVTRLAQEVHHLHHFAVRHRLVRAQENARVLLALGRRIKRGGQELASDGSLAEREGEIGLDREIERLLRPRLRLRRGGRQVDRNGRKRRRHHENDEQHQHDVDERRYVDLVHFVEAVAP